MTDGGPVFLDSSTEHMPQFEVVGIDAKEFSVARRDQGTGVMGDHRPLLMYVVFALPLAHEAFTLQLYGENNKWACSSLFFRNNWEIEGFLLTLY